MTVRPADRTIRNQPRHDAMFTESFGRPADGRTRRAGRHLGVPALMLACNFIEHAEIDRRSRFDTFAPARA